jgi:hypothetical protein
MDCLAGWWREPATMTRCMGRAPLMFIITNYKNEGRLAILGVSFTIRFHWTNLVFTFSLPAAMSNTNVCIRELNMSCGWIYHPSSVLFVDKPSWYLQLSCKCDRYGRADILAKTPPVQAGIYYYSV